MKKIWGKRFVMSVKRPKKSTFTPLVVSDAHRSQIPSWYMPIHSSNFHSKFIFCHGSVGDAGVPSDDEALKPNTDQDMASDSELEDLESDSDDEVMEVRDNKRDCGSDKSNGSKGDDDIVEN